MERSEPNPVRDVHDELMHIHCLHRIHVLETSTRVRIAVRNKNSIQISMHDRSRLSKTDRKAE